VTEMHDKRELVTGVGQKHPGVRSRLAATLTAVRGRCPLHQKLTARERLPSLLVPVEAGLQRSNAQLVHPEGPGQGVFPQALDMLSFKLVGWASGA
jgi:hypothetical protein